MADPYAAFTFAHDASMKPHSDSPSSVSDESSHGFDDASQQAFPNFDEFMPNGSTTFSDSFHPTASSVADFDDAEPVSASQESNAGPKRRSRRPPNTAERRATHNAVERARRETLNGRFMDLAAALPSMAHVKRPSKSMIVNKSLDFIETALAREKALLEQNDLLRSQLNELRAQRGLAPVDEAPLPTSNNKKTKLSGNNNNNQKTVERRDSLLSVQSEQSHSETSPGTVSSIDTPRTDSSDTSPKSTNVSLTASAMNHTRTAPADAGKFGSSFDGEMWGMRAQLQAAAQAVANAGALHQHMNTGNSGASQSTPSLSFDPFATQQSMQPGGSMDLGTYLMALQRQQPQTSYLQGIGAYSQTFGLQPQNMQALASQANPFAGFSSSFGSSSADSDKASSWF